MDKNEAQLIYRTKHEGTIALLELDGDMRINEFHEQCRRLALAAGYSHKCIEEYFGAGFE